MSENKAIYDIIQGIHQAAMNGRDENNENKPEFESDDSEKGDKIGNSSKNQTFFVKVNANKLMVTYEVISSISDVLQKDKYLEFLKTNLQVVEKFLKAEYKKVTGKTLKITKDGEPNSMTQNINGTKCFTVAKQLYTIEGLPEIKDEFTEKAVEDYNSMDKMLKESWIKYIKR